MPDILKADASATVDLTAARRIARGVRQKEWLDLLLDPRRGLDTDHPRDVRTWAAMNTFVRNLELAGYILTPEPEEQRVLFLTGADPRHWWLMAIGHYIRNVFTTQHEQAPEVAAALAHLDAAELKTLYNVLKACGDKRFPGVQSVEDAATLATALVTA